MADKKQPFHEQVAEELIGHLEAGTAPWQKPWEPGRVASLPMNLATGKAYRGINSLMLSMQDHTDPRWMTYKQSANADVQVRKGEKASTVEYWKWTAERSVLDDAGRPVLGDDGKPQKKVVRLSRPEVFYAKVFNAEQIDGLEAYQAPEPGFEPLEKAETVLAATNLTIKHDQTDRAFYQSVTDCVHLPGREAFNNAYDYYATALHEAGHATGHESRLDREMVNIRGSESYAREELRAEIASYMAARTLGVGHNPENHAAYVGSWIKALKEDPKEIFRAARDAEIIQEWITQPEKRPELEKAAKEKQAARTQRPEEDQKMTATSETRYYLTVSYAEKDAAKAAGAKWDRNAKSWYAPDGTDRTKLAAWDAAQGQAPESAKVPPQVEFAEVCRANGLIIEGEIAMDGQWHRVPVEADKKGQTSGSYRGYLDGKPNGQITNFKEDLKLKWVASGEILTAEDRTRLKTEAAEVRQQRITERDQSYATAAKKAYGVWKNSTWADQQKSTYLTEKDVPAFGVKHDGRDGRDGLIVPIRNVDGRLQSLQFIDKDGAKRMMQGGRKAGGMHFIDPKREIAERPIIIAEGYATAATLHAATGQPTVCAFDAGNLKAVATALREKYPETRMVIAADHDKIGLEKAHEAAREAGAKVVAPPFGNQETAQGTTKGLTDFNDLARTQGKEAVTEAVKEALDATLSRGAAPARTTPGHGVTPSQGVAPGQGDEGMAIGA